MKAMRLTGIRQMEMADVADPEVVRPDDVLVRMTRVGVCGSDIHYYTDGRIGSQIVKYPFAVGHEAAGVVVRVGPSVTHVKPGDHVAIEPAMPCGACDQCRDGRPNTCRALKFLGCPGQAEGCLSEFIVMPGGSCLPLAAGMDDDLGALSEPLAIGVYAVRQSGPVRGLRVGVLGSGPIGLSVILAAREAGAAAVYATDLVDARLAAARKAGADWSASPRACNVAAEVAKREPLMLDMVFECCGQQETVDQAIDLLKPGGVLSLIGIPTVDRISIPIDIARRREVRIQNVRRQAHCAEATLELLAQRSLRPEFMVTHRFPFARTAEAFDLVAGLRDGVIKAMIDF
jgi:L-iditol 2-dehydrogenase